MSTLSKIVIFNLIEAVGFLGGVGVWFKLHDAGHPIAGAVVGTIIWTVVTQIEHITAYNTGAGRKFLSIP